MSVELAGESLSLPLPIKGDARCEPRDLSSEELEAVSGGLYQGPGAEAHNPLS